MLNFFRRPSKIIGFFDGLVEGTVGGWAFCPDQPEQKLTVEILHGEIVIACGLANVFRDDLRVADIGDGHHAFNIRVDETKYGNSGYKVREQNTGIFLPFSSTIMKATKDGFLTKEECQNLLKIFLAEHGFSILAKRKISTMFDSAFQAQNTGALLQALDLFNKLLKEAFVHPLFYCKIGEIAEQSKDWPNAIKAYKSALDADPQFFWAYTGLGRTYQNCEKYRESLEYYIIAHILNPTNIGVANIVSELHNKTNNTNQNLSDDILIGKVEASRHLLDAAITQIETRNQNHSNL